MVPSLSDSWHLDVGDHRLRRTAEGKPLTRRYHRELEALPQTYQACLDWDIAPLTRVVETLIAGPLVVVGSGGSFSGAVFGATLHELHSRQMAKAVTPLQVVGSPERLSAGLLCLSASGRNKDIRAAFTASAHRETYPLTALCLATGSPLKALQSDFNYVDVIETALDIEPDGFLAVNSLFATCVLLTRAYRQAADRQAPLPSSYGALIAQTNALQSLEADRAGWIEDLTRRTISLLYSPPLAAGAADLESRFVEGALGDLHSADWRNFGHGRHHWLAKRGETTAVVAMVGTADQVLAARTLDLLPRQTPRRAVHFEGPTDEQGLLGMLFALHLAELAGEAAGIDPGRPGVPEFGRKLYHLGPKIRSLPAAKAAVARKARARGERIGAALEQAHDTAVERIGVARACGVVFDYDGTLCDRRSRFIPLPEDMVAGLVRLAETGTAIGIATGRGRSAGRALQDALPASLRGRVVVGYYNGSVILNANELPSDAELTPHAHSSAIAAELGRRWPNATVEARRAQVTLNLPNGEAPERWVGLVSELAWEIDRGARTLCSAHSVDVILGGFGKRAVVDAVRHLVGAPDTAVFRIGDKGRWPGNDVDLLSDPLGLSVDEVSQDLETCWNFAPAGILGPQATLYYMSRLSNDPQGKLVLSL
jgi:hypothetical protein